MSTESFEEVPIRRRFYQTSAFFPMPVVLVATAAESGQINLAPFSNCFPRAEDEGATLVLVAGAETKTARNIVRTGRATINFIPDEPRFLDNCMVLARPVATAEKMAESVFTLGAVPGSEAAPAMVAEAAQVFDCVWEGDGGAEQPGQEHRHFVLRVERILLKRRWREALDAGFGAPDLPVDFGFREPSARWLSRARTHVFGPRLRPRFEAIAAAPPDTIVERFRRALESPGSPYQGTARDDLVMMTLDEEHRTFWSPHMELRIEPHDEGSVVHARLGPHPHVWTMFIGLHLFVGFSTLVGAMFGFSQWIAAEPAWALWSIPVGLSLHAFVAGAAFVGQGLGADQIYGLRSFMEEMLR